MSDTNGDVEIVVRQNPWCISVVGSNSHAIPNRLETSPTVTVRITDPQGIQPSDGLQEDTAGLYVVYGLPYNMHLFACSMTD